ncbi:MULTISPECIES: pirin family protein [Heyndrickxia]|uniref:Pirin family protein n=2 Tax=Heyndrickxia sporothermodurans TaxID=46224 RepID=A0AB37HKH0_9BACI|nr:pirin-like C-terminal cupin domain-containing protein [Heyndrickxia sporothermodurans]MBL5769093.1 pirin family protein [Heyndrickxia sporothermodurans]MBL5772885.1 pirin family protein [Heyndrickxia sporothermodurans]MBL5776395.1 pirin family protein [Heyndrickxia sporothermodurans]MBL5780040.1 pirin family protein [Heyndrickxia sporothermodurans]MBL5783650.1 pirin family protein [Heyndrickxia sporothermodurans]
MSNESIFHRDIKDFWYPTYNKNGYPHVQQGVILNPERNQEFSPFILMAEDWYKRGVFADHPHRGFQTVTYVVDGRLEHIDNAGGYSLLNAGDVQYMNAGWAARHAEEAYDDDLIHTLQVWLNLPKSLKRTETAYQNIYVEDAPVVNFEGGSIRVYSGDIAGVKGPMNSLVPITMAEIILREGTEYTHILPENHNSFLYMLAGEMEFGESKTKIAKTGAATLSFNEGGSESNQSELKIKAKTRSKVLIYSGVPIREEIAFGGPFVMNTAEEIQEAFRDLQLGVFGPPAVKE